MYSNINIFLFVQDVKRGFIDNARCGYELMLETGNRIVKGADGTTDYFWKPPHGRPSGVLCARSPLPIVWNNLYISCLLGFKCKSYSDWTLHFAQLLNPVVFGSYQQVDPGLYSKAWVIAGRTIFKTLFGAYTYDVFSGRGSEGVPSRMDEVREVAWVL